jgi:hypothetical protein
MIGRFVRPLAGALGTMAAGYQADLRTGLFVVVSTLAIATGPLAGRDTPPAQEWGAKSGRQFVVIAAAQGNTASLMAFALK